MKVVTLEQYEEKFLKYCNEFYNLNDRNRNWFDPNNPGSIPNSYKKCPLWTFLLDDFEIVAPEDGSEPYLKYEDNEKTPAMYMLEAQLELTNYKHNFISVEFIRRKNSLVKLAKKLNDKYSTKWKVFDDLYHTYPNSDDPHSWQPVCVLQTDSKFPLKHISQTEWENIYGRKVFNTPNS